MFVCIYAYMFMTLHFDVSMFQCRKIYMMFLTFIYVLIEVCICMYIHVCKFIDTYV